MLFDIPNDIISSNSNDNLAKQMINCVTVDVLRPLASSFKCVHACDEIHPSPSLASVDVIIALSRVTIVNGLDLRYSCLKHSRVLRASHYCAAHYQLLASAARVIC